MSMGKFFGGILVTLGWLIMLIAGGCTLGPLIYTLLTNPRNISEGLALSGLGLAFSIIPFLIGYVLCGLGNENFQNKHVMQIENKNTEEE